MASNSDSDVGGFSDKKLKYGGGECKEYRRVLFKRGDTSFW